MEEGRRERKVVTLLFVDLVGFTSRAEEMDPEDVEAELRRYHVRVRTELERFGGTVEKFIGDAVVGVFGAPTAHEDDPERAVRAALAVRDWALGEDGIEVRIGVNTGEAVVRLDARPEAGEGMAAGDVVNTAARLQAGAPPNGIAVGDATRRSTGTAITYRELPPIAAKGKAEPVPAWEAVEARSRLGLDAEEAPRIALVGRERELHLLAGAFERAREEREPQLVTLVGVPGIGKSRLVHELSSIAEEDTELITWRQGRCLPYGDGVTFWALGEIVKAHAGILETDSREDVERKLHEVVGDPRLETHLGALAGLGTADLTSGDRRGETFAAWREFFESVAETGSLVLVIEDIHWADDDLLDFIDHLVEWASAVPILVVATARPELLQRRPTWGGGKPNALTVSLSPLSRSDTARLLGELLEQPLMSAETQAELLARADGNPLYAEQYARILMERGELTDLPETVQGIVAARLDLLEPDQKRLLQDAAVLGRTFWTGGLATVSGLEPRVVEERLHDLERRDFVRRDRRTTVADQTQYAFMHVLARDVAYAQLPRTERADRHRLAASWIESLGRPEDQAEMLAHHYLAALELSRAAGEEDETLVERARVALREAGDRALALSAFPAAVRFYTQAFELSPGEDPERPEFLLRFGMVLHQTDDDRAEKVLDESARLLVEAGRSERAAEARVLLSELWWDRGKAQSSFQQLTAAHDLVETADPAAKAGVLARMSRQQMLAGQSADSVRTGREGLAIAESLGLDELRSDLLNSIGCARFQLGEDAGGVADLEESVRIAVAIDSPRAALSYNNLGVMTLTAGDVRRDRELREEGLRIAKRFGNKRGMRFQDGVAIQHAYMCGDWALALALADAFIAECEAGAPHYLEPTAHLIRALLSLSRDAEAAAPEAQRAEDLAREAEDPQIVTPVLAVRLRIESELGSLDEAATRASALLALKPQIEFFPPGVELAFAATGLDNAGDVRAWIDAIPPRSKWNDAALRVLDGDFAGAADLFYEIGSIPDEARARMRAGDPANVGRALDFYRSVGATRYIREAETLLEATA